MNDITEIIVKELEQCLDDSVVAIVPADTVRNAIFLLKAQEPAMVNITIAQSDGWKEGNCPLCGMKLDSFYNWSFCGSCGKAVKWDA